MDATFISIHDMSKDARILYASDSIEYILGYLPHEVINKPCWDYFHPEEMPFAQSVHGRGVQLDKAAVLRYCRVKHKLGFWVCCECVFSVVYNVLVACTSIYRQGMSSQKRAVDAPIVRRMFTSSPRDPRYHMLSYLSNKFAQPPTSAAHEPRAALFLNRFTRTLTIMFATDGVEEILGIAPRQLVSKSFYFCIQEQCLHDAVRCLERAKVNNSIAYLRFWYRDPLQNDNPAAAANLAAMSNNPDNNVYGDRPTNISTAAALGPGMTATHEPVTVPQNPGHDPIEIEAVVSCSSDGLVVVLRRARPSIPLHQTLPSPQTQIAANGTFASPWATNPIIPPYATQPMPVQTTWPPSDSRTIYPSYNHTYGSNPTIPSGYPGYPGHPGYPGYPPYMNNGPGGPHPQDFLSTIRDVAVFAWGIVGINGSLEQYRRGQPSGDALPPDGIPIWNPQLGEDEFGLEEQEKETKIKVEAEQPEALTRNEGLT